MIYLKGEHEITVHTNAGNDCIFDGIIYAPEGTVNLECGAGMFRGIVIAKKVNFTNSLGDGKFSVMEKDSVMNIAKEMMKDLW